MSSPYPDNTNWPPSWRKSTLRGKFVGTDGVVQVGTLTFTQSPAAVTVPADDVIVPARPLTAQLDSTGAFTLVVPASDDPSITPNGWTYIVVENWDGGRTYPVEAPLGQIVDLNDVAPIGEFAGVVVATGAPGQGLRWRATWAIDSTYEPLDTVKDGGVVYICIEESTGDDPSTDTTHWAPIGGGGGGGGGGSGNPLDSMTLTDVSGAPFDTEILSDIAPWTLPDPWVAILDGTLQIASEVAVIDTATTGDFNASLFPAGIIAGMCADTGETTQVVKFGAFGLGAASAASGSMPYMFFGLTDPTSTTPALGVLACNYAETDSGHGTITVAFLATVASDGSFVSGGDVSGVPPIAVSGFISIAWVGNHIYFIDGSGAVTYALAAPTLSTGGTWFGMAVSGVVGIQSVSRLQGAAA